MKDRFRERDPQRNDPGCGGDERRPGYSGVGSAQEEMSGSMVLVWGACSSIRAIPMSLRGADVVAFGGRL